MPLTLGLGSIAMGAGQEAKALLEGFGIGVSGVYTTTTPLLSSYNPDFSARIKTGRLRFKSRLQNEMPRGESKTVLIKT